MGYWLFDHVTKEDDERAPQWALQSTLNWMKALSFEINREYGVEPTVQFNTCRNALATKGNAKASALPLAQIFEPLFHSLTFCSTLISMSRSGNIPPWVYPSAVISWYYSHYNAFRAMLGANNQSPADTHASVAKTLNSGLRSNLPHPFNMIATRTTGENYQVTLPDYPQATSFDLVKTFPGTRGAAQGMVLQYLSGTAKYETYRTKEAILNNKKYNFTDFKTKAAREQRDKQLQGQINFMHCAFRYRGKANYRDAIYITYGQRELSNNTFMSDLANSARFAFICGLAFTEKHMGQKKVRSFLDDLRTNLRGAASVDREEVFWQDFTV